MLTDRQSDRQTWAKTCTSSFVGGNNNEVLMRCGSETVEAGELRSVGPSQQLQDGPILLKEDIGEAQPVTDDDGHSIQSDADVALQLHLEKAEDNVLSNSQGSGIPLVCSSVSAAVVDPHPSYSSWSAGPIPIITTAVNRKPHDSERQSQSDIQKRRPLLTGILKRKVYTAVTAQCCISSKLITD